MEFVKTFNYERKWDEVQECMNNIRQLEKQVEELTNVYSREKVAIEAKTQSLTQMKNTIVKNTKIENKITTADSIIDNKLTTYDDGIRLNEERRERDIRVIRDNYQARLETLERKMKIEIDAVEARCDKYGVYLKDCKKQLETKKDCVIRDLSCNIIPIKIGDDFDEAAYPRLTKLKFDITLKEKELAKKKQEKELLYKQYQDAYEKQQRDNEIERRRKEYQEKQEEERKRQEAIKQLQAQREAQKQADEARWERQKQERIAEAEAKAQHTNWISNVYVNLPDEYKQLISLFDKQYKEEIKLYSCIEDVIDYIDTIKPQLIKLKVLEDLYTNNTSKNDMSYFKDNIWDMYGELPFNKKLEIAQMNKLAQIIHIKKYHSELPKPETYEDED